MRCILSTKVSIVNDFTNGAMQFNVAAVIALCERNFVNVDMRKKCSGPWHTVMKNACHELQK